MLANVTFERGLRQYRVEDPISGEVEFFPSGNDGRKQAHQRAIALHNPRLFKIAAGLIQQHPYLASRVWRACELVIHEAVQCCADSDLLAMVTGSSEYGDYLICKRDGLIICDCLDYMQGNAPYIGPTGQRFCKHILAWQLAERLAYRHCYSCQDKVPADSMVCPLCTEPVTPY